MLTKPKYTFYCDTVVEVIIQLYPKTSFTKQSITVNKIDNNLELIVNLEDLFDTYEEAYEALIKKLSNKIYRFNQEIDSLKYQINVASKALENLKQEYANRI